MSAATTQHDDEARIEAELKKHQAEQAKKRARFNRADIAGRVRLAMPMAREMMQLALIDLSECAANEEGLEERIEALAGASLPEVLLEGPPGHEVALREAQLCLRVAYALGVAAGLYLSPELFTATSMVRGGAR